MVDRQRSKRHQRTLVLVALMLAQTGLYTAVYATCVQTLSRMYSVRSEQVFHYLWPMALSSALAAHAGKALLQTHYARALLAASLTLGALLLAYTGVVFQRSQVTADSLTALWCVSACLIALPSSAAYLTVSQRSSAWFYSVSSMLSAWLAITPLGTLIRLRTRNEQFSGYVLAAVLLALIALANIRHMLRRGSSARAPL